MLRGLIVTTLLFSSVALLADSPASPLDFYLPVTTPGLAPGPVEPRTGRTGLTQPLFLVGADRRSRAWLQQHAARLTALQAIGLVVNVQTRRELDGLRQLVPALDLYPVPGDALATHFDLHHYPVLVTADGLSQ